MCFRRASWRKALSLVLPLTALAVAAAPRTAQAQFYNINNIVSSPGAGVSSTTNDPNLINAWGIAFSATSPVWIADTGSGLSTVYNATTGAVSSTVVTVRKADGSLTGGSPVGIVFGGGGLGFTGGTFIFDTADGAIESWSNGTSAVIQNVDSTAVYRGLAVANTGGSNFLYAADFANNKINVFNTSYALTSLTGNFTDPGAVAGYSAYNIQAVNIGGTTKLAVAYAKQNASKTFSSSGAGQGYIDLFNTDGTFSSRVATGSAIAGGNSLLTSLNAPWGITVAPAGAGFFANDLLVGNFGNGQISAFDPVTGDFKGVLEDAFGQPLVQQGLWALTYGSGAPSGNGGNANTLYFTAGPKGQAQGVFGSITPTAAAPEPASLALIAVLAPAFRRFRRVKRNNS